MSERGVFAIDRGIWDHPVFADEPLTEREAWQWLIGEASFKARTRNVSGRIVKLARGQLSASVRFMADRWKWSKSAVDRFLDKLRAETMIGTDSGTGILVITICNYNKYQKVSLPDGTDTGTQSGTVAGQERDKTESTESIEVGEKDIQQPDDWPEDFREVFWAAYPRKVGKQGALRELDRVRRKSVSFEKLISAVRAYSATADPEFTKHPQTWLSKGCWDDEPDTRKPNVRKAAGSPILAELDANRERIAALGLRHRASPDHARLLSQGGGERSGNVLDCGFRGSRPIQPERDLRGDKSADGPAEQNRFHADAEGAEARLRAGGPAGEPDQQIGAAPTIAETRVKTGP